MLWTTVTRRMAQGNVHLTADKTPLPDILFHRTVLAGIAVLVAQPLEHTPGRVALLARTELVVLQNRVDDDGERTEHGTADRLAAAIARRLGAGQYLANRRPAQTENTTRMAGAVTRNKTKPSNLDIHIHVIHPPPSIRLVDNSDGKFKGWPAFAAPLPQKTNRHVDHYRGAIYNRLKIFFSRGFTHIPDLFFGLHGI